MTVTALHPLFASADADKALAAVRDREGALVDGLTRHLNAALHGSDEATRRYVHDYRALVEIVLAEAREVWPELVAEASEGRLAPVDAEGRPLLALVLALEHASAEAPFSPWTGRFDPGDAVVVDLVGRVRLMVGAAALAAPVGRARVDVDELDAQRFLRRVRHELNHPDDENPLHRVMDVFGLSKSEMGRMFGVRRQAIDGWLAHGVPADRQEKLAAVLALADLLARKLKADRIAGVTRRPADAYDGLTMLEMLAADRHSQLLASVRDSFAWSQAA